MALIVVLHRLIQGILDLVFHLKVSLTLGVLVIDLFLVEERLWHGIVEEPPLGKLTWIERGLRRERSRRYELRFILFWLDTKGLPKRLVGLGTDIAQLFLRVGARRTLRVKIDILICFHSSWLRQCPIINFQASLGSSCLTDLPLILLEGEEVRFDLHILLLYIIILGHVLSARVL